MAKDATTILQKDHDKVRKLLKELTASKSQAQKRRGDLLEQIANEIRLHSRLEEEIFYPAFEAAAKKADQHLYHEAVEEHRLADLELEALEECDPTEPLFAARAKVLRDLIEHHATEEEEEMFPRVRDLLTKEELEELGTQIEDARAEAEPERTRRTAGAAKTRR
jgi:hemerythrin superfamily protein